jgi:hypothetical protein
MNKGDLSKLMEETVRWRFIEQTLDETRTPFPYLL